MEQFFSTWDVSRALWVSTPTAMWEIDYFEHVIGLVLIGLIPAFIAYKKGRNFFQWWLFGAVLFIIALPAALYITPADGPAWWE